MLSNPIGSNQEGQAQQTSPTGAGTARAEAGGAEGHQPLVPPSDQEIRWVGEQHRMHGYCGRALEPGKAVAAAAKSEDRVGARIIAVRPVSALQRRRYRVVRIGPRPVAVGRERAAEGHDGMNGETQQETQPRAA